MRNSQTTSWLMTTIDRWILFEDDDLIVMNKPPGMPVQARDQPDLCHHLEAYLKLPPFPIHRIDQPASGLVLFAKKRKAASSLSALVRRQGIDRTYLAVVGKKPEPATGRLVHYLVRSPRSNRMIVTDIDVGQRAELQYEVLPSRSEHYYLLQVVPITGRRHQIRAQFGAIDNPIKGDNKYGFKRGNQDRSIHLHGWKMSFTDWNGALRQFEASPPDEVLWNAFDLS